MSGNTLTIVSTIKRLFFILLFFNSYSSVASGKARITVDFNVSPKPDTLYLLKYPAIRYKGFSAPEVLQALREPSGLYRFEIGITDKQELYRISRKIDNDTANVYFKLFIGGSNEYFELTGDIYFREGDDVMLTISKHKPDIPPVNRWFETYKTQISGAGSAMHYAKQKSDSLLFKVYDNKPSFDKNLNYYHRQGKIRELALAHLDSVRRQISESHFNLLRTGITYHGGPDLFNKLESFYESYRSDGGSPELFKKAYDSAIDRYFTQQIGSPDEDSDNYIRFISRKAFFDSYIAGVPEPAEYAFSLLASQYTGRVRDKALIMLLTSVLHDISPTLYAKAASVVENQECKTLVNLLGARGRGVSAYDFELEDTDGRTHRLSDMKGKWVYIDFWFTGCGACTYFFENALGETEQHFADDPQIVFVSVSVDKGKTRWINSVKSGEYTSGHALNLYTNGQGWQHELLLHYGVNSYPSAILVDPDGKIYRYNTPDLLVRNAPDLIATLQAYMDNKATGDRRE